MNEEIVNQLNDWLEKDDEAISSLVNHRVKLNPGSPLIEDSKLVVLHQDGIDLVGLLGILNGLLTAPGEKRLAGRYDGSGKLEGFTLVEPRTPEEEKPTVEVEADDKVFDDLIESFDLYQLVVRRVPSNEFSTSMRQHQSVFGADEKDRYWVFSSEACRTAWSEQGGENYQGQIGILDTRSGQTWVIQPAESDG